MTVIDQSEEIAPAAPMTEEEFLAWYAGRPGKAEWAEGKVFVMMAVSGGHDRLQWWLRNLLQFYAEPRGLGRVYGPQFPIRLKDKRLEPDVLLVSAEGLPRLTPTYLDGSPLLAIEIVSPESESRDWRDKYLWYEAAGVREYWVVDASSERVEAYSMGGDGRYQHIDPAGSGDSAKIISRAVNGWWLKPVWLWQFEKVDVLKALDEIIQARKD